MKRTLGVKGTLGVLGILIGITAPAAADVTGVWIRSEGTAKVQFAPCGDSVCGTVVWLKNPDGPGKIGEQVFFGMKASGANKWTGSAYNPQDGRTYDGSMTQSGNHLTTTGCALGGMICKSVSWSRSR